MCLIKIYAELPPDQDAIFRFRFQPRERKFCQIEVTIVQNVPYFTNVFSLFFTRFLETERKARGCYAMPELLSKVVREAHASRYHGNFNPSVA